LQKKKTCYALGEKHAEHKKGRNHRGKASTLPFYYEQDQGSKLQQRMVEFHTMKLPLSSNML
jgi:hypothetical protein